MTLRRIALAFAVVTLAACGDEGPVSGPGTLTYTLESPNGSEGAALVVLLGDDVGAVSAVGVAEVYSQAGNSQTRIVLINEAGGELSFRVSVADTTQPPAWVIHEVAGPDDELRDLVGYSLVHGS